MGLRAEGWRPVPFREFIVKIHSRCDLACDYCYMYEMADQCWRDRPRKMSEEVASQTAMRIGEHARTHGLRRIALVLHGGEPFWRGAIYRVPGYLVRREAGPGVRVDVTIQTNAVGLDEPYLRLLDELGVGVGVSLDGARRRMTGIGGSPAGEAAMMRWSRDCGGLPVALPAPVQRLIVHDRYPQQSVSTYEALTSFEPPKIDFLLPHGTWASPPPGRMPQATETPYADWLITIFDRWYFAPQTRIRLFDEIMRLILGEDSAAETVGPGSLETAGRRDRRGH